MLIVGSIHSEDFPSTIVWHHRNGFFTVRTTSRVYHYHACCLTVCTTSRVYRRRVCCPSIRAMSGVYHRRVCYPPVRATSRVYHYHACCLTVCTTSRVYRRRGSCLTVCTTSRVYRRRGCCRGRPAGRRRQVALAAAPRHRRARLHGVRAPRPDLRPGDLSRPPHPHAAAVAARARGGDRAVRLAATREGRPRRAVLRAAAGDDRRPLNRGEYTVRLRQVTANRVQTPVRSRQVTTDRVQTKVRLRRVKTDHIWSAVRAQQLTIDSVQSTFWPWWVMTDHVQSVVRVQQVTTYRVPTMSRFWRVTISVGSCCRSVTTVSRPFKVCCPCSTSDNGPSAVSSSMRSMVPA